MAAEFRVLGAVEAVNDGRPLELGHRMQRSVLAVLLVQANRPVPVDQFMTHVWGEHWPRRGSEVLYSYLSRLRTILALTPEASIQRHSSGYLLAVDEASVDLHRFRQQVTQARASAAADTALTLFEQALGLWRGSVFAGLDSLWLASVRTAIEAERRAAQRDRADAALRCGRHAELLAELTIQAERDPLDERLAGQLMLTLYRTGRQADALGHYQRLRAALAEQLATSIIAHRMLGRGYVYLDRHDDGITNLRLSLALAEKHRHTSHQAHAHRALAWAWSQRQDFSRARHHATRAVALHRALDHPAQEADVLNQVGWYTARLGDFGAARHHCQIALDQHRRHHNRDGEANTLDSLGYIAHHTGDHLQAITHYQHALGVRRVLGDTVYCAQALDVLGHPYLALGQREQARAVWQEALELYRQQHRDHDASRVQHHLDVLDSKDF